MGACVRVRAHVKLALLTFLECATLPLPIVDQFRARDVQRNGTATFQYDDVCASVI